MAANGELLSAGELPHFRVGLVLEVLRLDAWYVDGERSQRVQAVYITQGLSRRCCLPELILRCMEVLHYPQLLLSLEVTDVYGFDLMVESCLFSRRCNSCAVDFYFRRSSSLIVVEQISDV
jgi:hypothetical protein